MTVFASSGKARTFNYQAGDVGYVPFATGHYIENTGEETLTFLEMFRSNRFADVSLSQWLALTPAGLVQAHLNLDAQAMATLSGREDKAIIVRWPAVRSRRAAARIGRAGGAARQPRMICGTSPDVAG